MKIRCVIVDDEPLAVTLIASYTEKVPGMEIVLKTTHVLEALQAVQTGKADLIFLDVQMPELTGIQFMKIIRQSCQVILTTAYAQYALEGYEHDIVDYLLKPVTLDRFMIAVEKAKRRIISESPNTRKLPGKDLVNPASTDPVNPVSKDPGNKQSQQEAGYSRSAQPDRYIFLKSEYQIRKIDLDDIYYISALRDYIAVHTKTGRILSLDSLRNMTEVLPEKQFIRIHKSYIINRDKIELIERGGVIINKERLPIGDTYRAAVKESLGR